MRILADTCGGLHAAHELTREGRPLGVIHRDVSPHNILVSDRGIAKLIDFGIAKANDRLAGDTATGLAKGKIRYMAPEQALAKDLDRRVDIWSVGAVAYDLLEGRPPFDGPNDLARMYLLLGHDPAPPMTVKIPQPFERLIFRALERKPKNRFATAQEMKAAIESAMEAASLHVTIDDVAAFFEPWMQGEDLEADPATESSQLREKLALRERRSVRTATVDVAAPPRDGIETLTALDSSLIPGITAHVRSWRSWAVVGAATLAAVAGTWRLARHDTVTAPVTTAAPRPIASTPAAEPAAPEPVVSIIPVPDPPRDAPRAKPRPPRPPAARPGPAKPRAAPSSRPRYEDTIQ
jgi:serine/threonine-protein kinase